MAIAGRWAGAQRERNDMEGVVKRGGIGGADLRRCEKLHGRVGLIGGGCGMESVVLTEEVSCIGHKLKQHSNLALDVDFTIDVTGVSFDRAGLYAQYGGYFAVSVAL